MVHVTMLRSVWFDSTCVLLCLPVNLNIPTDLISERPVQLSDCDSQTSDRHTLAPCLRLINSQRR